MKGTTLLTTFKATVCLELQELAELQGAQSSTPSKDCPVVWVLGELGVEGEHGLT